MILDIRNNALIATDAESHLLTNLIHLLGLVVSLRFLRVLSKVGGEMCAGGECELEIRSPSPLDSIVCLT